MYQQKITLTFIYFMFIKSLLLINKINDKNIYIASDIYTGFFNSERGFEN